MSPVNRKVEYRLYPKPKQLEGFDHTLALHQRLWNAGLEQRIDAYKKQKKSLSFAYQCKELTDLRKEFPEYRALNAQSCQVTLKRLDLAFQHFFRRIKEGQTQAGFPRFKSKERFSGFGFKTHGDGFRFESSGKHGYLRLSGIGRIRIRGKARNWGELRTCEIIRRGDRWYVSVTLRSQPKRQKGTSPIGLDWGLESFATLALPNEKYKKIENPRFLKKSLLRLKSKQQELARKKKGSQNRKKATKKLRKVHDQVRCQRKNHLHQVSAEIITQASQIATEKLSVKAMTVHGGVYKKGLNREILNTAPAAFISLLQYKAEEAGTQWIEVPTRKVKPSQTCSGCGRQKKKSLSERFHHCSDCGCQLGRDENAARVMYNWAFARNVTGWEPSRCGEGALAPLLKQETLAIAVSQLGGM